MADVLCSGPDLQLRNYTESKCIGRKGREEERHTIKHARNHRGVGANCASAADKKNQKNIDR